MPSRDEIVRDALRRFLQVQTWIEIAQNEQASNTVASLMEEYRYQKALLQGVGFNMDEVDRIKK